MSEISIPVDAITTVFIFLVGLPAIMLQILPSEIRRTVIQERAQLIVYNDEASGVCFNTGFLQCEIVGVGLTSDGQQQVRADNFVVAIVAA